MTKRKYTIGEDMYLEDNFKKFTDKQMGESLGRSEASVTQRLSIIRKKGKIGFKLAKRIGNNNQFMGNSNEMKLMVQGQRNKLSIADFKNRIINGGFIRLMIGENIEKCLVEYVNKSYFTVKRKNYRDSYKFVELMQGTVTILA